MLIDRQRFRSVSGKRFSECLGGLSFVLSLSGIPIQGCIVCVCVCMCFAMNLRGQRAAAKPPSP